MFGYHLTTVVMSSTVVCALLAAVVLLHTTEGQSYISAQVQYNPQAQTTGQGKRDCQEHVTFSEAFLLPISRARDSSRTISQSQGSGQGHGNMQRRSNGKRQNSYQTQTPQEKMSSRRQKNANEQITFAGQRTPQGQFDYQRSNHEHILAKVRESDALFQANTMGTLNKTDDCFKKASMNILRRLVNSSLRSSKYAMHENMKLLLQDGGDNELYPLTSVDTVTVSPRAESFKTRARRDAADGQGVNMTWTDVKNNSDAETMNVVSSDADRNDAVWEDSGTPSVPSLESDSKNTHQVATTTARVINTVLTSTKPPKTVIPPASTSGGRQVYGRIGCHDKCTCPDRAAMSKVLIPYLRMYAGDSLDSFDDGAIERFLYHHFLTDPETVNGSLSLLNIWMATANVDRRLTSLFEAARFGMTMCWLTGNDSFVLDSSAEASLFPQAHPTDVSQPESNSALTHSNVNDGVPGNMEAESFSTSELYNITFVCARGNRVLIKSGVTLKRYGRWRQLNCEVTTEKPLYVKGEMSLMVLMITGSDTFWLRNISASANSTEQFEDGKMNIYSVNSKGADDYYNGTFTRENGGSQFSETAGKGKDANGIDVNNGTSVTDSDEKTDSKEAVLFSTSVTEAPVSVADSVTEDSVSEADSETVYPALHRSTIFPNVREVNIINTSLTVQALSDILSWFQNADDVTLKDNGLEDFDCQQLLPSPATWSAMHLAANGLRSVPPCILRHSLVDLRLPDNDISDITSLQFPRYVPAPQLETLDLTNNNISDLGVLADMPNLLVLYLGGNRITKLSKLSFVRLPGLGLLNISRNALHVLDPGTFKALPFMKEMDLSHNFLTTFDRSLSPMRLHPGTYDCTIFLDHNRFSHPPFEKDGYIADWYIVHAEENPYACDCDMEIYVDALNSSVLTKELFPKRMGMVCEYPKELAGRRVDGLAFTNTCPLVTDCPDDCTCSLTRPSQRHPPRDSVDGSFGINGLKAGLYTSLATTNNELTLDNLDSGAHTTPSTRDMRQESDFNTTSTAFSDYTDTVSVICISDDWSRLPSRLPDEDKNPLKIHVQSTKTSNHSIKFTDAQYLSRVVEMNVSGIGLEYLPDLVCEAMPGVKLLDLSHNSLSIVPKCLQTRNESSPSLEIRLGHNPVKCDCKNVWMKEWMASMLEEHTGQPDRHLDDVRAEARSKVEVRNQTKARGQVKVTDANEVFCSTDTHPGTLVAHWDTDECVVFNYLPLVITLSVVLVLALILGPIIYVNRLKAAVAIHAHLHVRPFVRAKHFDEAEYDHEALVVHGDDRESLRWVLDTLLPHMDMKKHRLCIPERDFSLGASIADSYSEAVARSKCVVCLLTKETVTEEWWRFAFQIARAQNARRPQNHLLVVLLEHVEDDDMPEEVQSFQKTNTYLSADDKWFWKKLLYYLPDPPPQ